jgi:hypothetical protein
LALGTILQLGRRAKVVCHSITPSMLGNIWKVMKELFNGIYERSHKLKKSCVVMRNW